MFSLSSSLHFLILISVLIFSQKRSSDGYQSQFRRSDSNRRLVEHSTHPDLMPERQVGPSRREHSKRRSVTFFFFPVVCFRQTRFFPGPNDLPLLFYSLRIRIRQQCKGRFEESVDANAQQQLRNETCSRGR